MATEMGLVTAAELERMPQEEGHVELVMGVIVKMPPGGGEHGGIAATILIYVGNFVRQQQLGRVYAAETGFFLSRNPDNVRAPDVAFVTKERVAQQRRRTGFFDGAPDLAVEVVSPTDPYGEVEEKVLEYLAAGTRLVWVANPRTKTITAYRSLTDIRKFTQNDVLDGGDVLPGFTVPVKELFE